MQIINRFIQLADRFAGRRIELADVFHDAADNEVDAVLEALYVIANRRFDSGDPVQLEEIANAIPDLIDDESVLEVAVEISIDGLVATGHHERARADSMAQQLRDIAQAKRVDTTRSFRSTDLQSGPEIHQERTRLPREFGPEDLDGNPRYELRRVLGSGNQGVVYEAVDRVFSDKQEPMYVAVKVFYERHVNNKSSTEGRIARKIRHRHVAAVTDQGITDDGAYYVAYELVEGLPLDDWLSKNNAKVSVQDKLRIAIDIAKGVQAAHAAGIVHRDLKPSNILMDSESRPVITDFGIASTKLKDPVECGRYGTRGSLAFMAPEQFQSEHRKDAPLVDIYAVGGVLFWMLSARFPNGDRVPDAVEWLETHEQGGPLRLRDSFRDRRVRALLMRSLALDPNERYQSAEAVAHDLACIIGHAPMLDVDDDVWSRSLLFVKRNTALAAMYAVIMLLVGGLVGLVMYNQSQQRFTVAAMIHQTELDTLSHEVEVERVRADGYKERMDMARTLLGSWTKTLDAEASESAVLFNLLFLHSQSQINPLSDEPSFLMDLLDKKIEVAIAHAEALDETSTSPIERALWFELIAGWLQPTQPERAGLYRDRAVKLVTEYAPEDTQWLKQLQESSGS